MLIPISFKAMQMVEREGDTHTQREIEIDKERKVVL